MDKLGRRGEHELQGIVKLLPPTFRSPLAESLGVGWRIVENAVVKTSATTGDVTQLSAESNTNVVVKTSATTGDVTQLQGTWDSRS